VTPTIPAPARRAGVLLAALAAPFLVAGPAAADVPEGWSEPEPVSVLEALLILGGIPLGLFVLILLAVYLPALARGERVAAGQPAMDNQWIGGPRKSTGELAAPDTEDSDAGGASARW
jgi:hypothetical protein